LTIRANLRRIEAIPWITGNVSLLDALREVEQPGVVHLAVLSAAPRHHALEVVSYVLRQGKVAGRRIAAHALAEFGGPEANELAVRLMEDDDAQVRGAAARQLRERNVPGAIQRLLVLLDSPHEVERDAAQAGLIEFTFDRFSANFDQLTPQARETTGALVRRVDPEAIDRVRSELDQSARSRRKRALELAVALKAVVQLQDSIVAILKDEDQYLRIDAIRTLATVNNPVTRQALRDALLDSQALVQQAAEAALRDLTRGDTVWAAADASRDTVPLPGRSPGPESPEAVPAPPAPLVEAVSPAEVTR
jgi:HEAT repeat protein